MKTDAWMPLWIGSYLADTQHLARDEHGGYLLLIMAYWRTGTPLPDDDKRLAAIARATSKEWKVLRPVMAEFFTVADGLWRHKRIDQELEGAANNRAQKSAAGKASAAKRWGNGEHNGKVTGVITDVKNPLQRQSNPTPSPTPTPKDKGKTIRADALLAALGVSDQTASDWIALRKAKRAAITQTALDGIQREADKAGYSLETALRVCCERGWTGFKAEWVNPRAGPVGGVQDARLDTARQIMGDRHGNHGQIIDVTPSGSDSGGRARLSEIADGLRESTLGEMAGDGHASGL